MHHRKTYMHINFQHNRVVDRSKLHTIFLQKIASCINLQLPIVILKKINYFSMKSMNAHTRLVINVNYNNNNNNV